MSKKKQKAKEVVEEVGEFDDVDPGEESESTTITFKNGSTIEVNTSVVKDRLVGVHPITLEKVYL